LWQPTAAADTASENNQVREKVIMILLEQAEVMPFQECQSRATRRARAGAR
jgi:hypothetical protein